MGRSHRVTCPRCKNKNGPANESFAGDNKIRNESLQWENRHIASTRNVDPVGVMRK
jgi:hypothetical protein